MLCLGDQYHLLKENYRRGHGGERRGEYRSNIISASEPTGDSIGAVALELMEDN